MISRGTADASPRRGLSPVWLMLFAVALVVAPFLFWKGTWFGRALNDDEMARYLADRDKPRHVQHALSQIADRIVRGDQSVEKWYPRVIEASFSPLREIRSTAAWVMGQDSRNQRFHAALASLLTDREPMVKRNAAVSLVRFQDGRGKPVLVEMLTPYPVQAPQAGRFTPRLKEGDPVNVGTLLGRLAAASGEPLEVRSPVPGEVRAIAAGAETQPGDELARIAPNPDQVWEALRALYLVGDAGDLPEVQRYARPVDGMPERIQQQARLTAGAIRSRSQEQGAGSREQGVRSPEP